MRPGLRVALLWGILAFVPTAGGCAGGDDADVVRRPPCERGDTRAGCEQERIECLDPKRCH